jgi:hypothetical protein
VSSVTHDVQATAKLGRAARTIRRMRDAYPTVIELEDRIAQGLSPRQVNAIKRWLVDVATRVRD